ncbi:unnamed protein product [Lactuca virosa]|uniref:Transmembrane protein n=1 Tax=Lactuca virosa TaxID=75947 RepID=A0AAU9M8P0_9ASTR|nr:unnamed protein product [Lactuca virosa]
MKIQNNKTHPSSPFADPVHSHHHLNTTAAHRLYFHSRSYLKAPVLIIFITKWTLQPLEHHRKSPSIRTQPSNTTCYSVATASILIVFHYFIPSFRFPTRRPPPPLLFLSLFLTSSFFLLHSSFLPFSSFLSLFLTSSFFLLCSSLLFRCCVFVLPPSACFFCRYVRHLSNHLIPRKRRGKHPPNSSTVPTCITADIVATPAAALSLPLCLNKSSGVEGKDCEESSLRRRRG